MKKYYLIVFVYLISIIIGCSTVDTTKDSLKKEVKPKTTSPKKEPKVLKYISLMTSIEYINNGKLNEFNASINQNNDTLGLKVLGPFNVSVAELFSTKDRFYLLDKWNGILFKGQPTKENFKKTLQISISYDDIIGLIRCNPYGDFKRFTKTDKEGDTAETYVFADAVAKDSIWFSKKVNNITRYIHKSKISGESYSVNYTYGESNEYPEKIVFLSGKNKLSLKIDDFSLKKFSVKKFKIPEKAKVVDLDEEK